MTETTKQEETKLPTENAKTSKMSELSKGPMGFAKSMIGLFSTVRQRSPPKSEKTKHIRLITISASHFCEKVRWVLDHVEARDDNPYYYTEDSHPPAFQSYETLKVSDHEASITPMIIFENETGKKELLYDSATILQQFMPELYPEEIKSQIEEIEADLGKRLGASLRCYTYYYILGDIKRYKKGMVQLNADPRKVSKAENFFFGAFLDKGLGDGIRNALDVNEATARGSEAALRSVFAEYSKKLEESGGEYLLDTKDMSYGFTAADLTLAALSFPYMSPPEMELWNVDDGLMPDEVVAMKKELRATTAGKHALKIYKKHRLPTSTDSKDSSSENTPPAGGVVTLKSENRNKYPWENMSSSCAVSLLGGSAAAIAIVLYTSMIFIKKQR